MVSSDALHALAHPNEHALMLYLQCLVSILRLLSLHASLPGSGTVTSTFVQSVYTRVNEYRTQYVEDKDAEAEDLDAEDFNSEFLFTYALDIISAMPSEGVFLRDLLDKVGTMSCLSSWVILLCNRNDLLNVWLLNVS
jgi:hypothetical protein